MGDCFSAVKFEEINVEGDVFVARFSQKGLLACHNVDFYLERNRILKFPYENDPITTIVYSLDANKNLTIHAIYDNRVRTIRLDKNSNKYTNVVAVIKGESYDTTAAERLHELYRSLTKNRTGGVKFEKKLCSAD